MRPTYLIERTVLAPHRPVVRSGKLVGGRRESGISLLGFKSQLQLHCLLELLGASDSTTEKWG